MDIIIHTIRRVFSSARRARSINAILLVFVLLLTGVAIGRTSLAQFVKDAWAAIAAIDGAGTINQIAAFSNTNTIGDSIITDTGTNIGIGTTVPTSKLHILNNGGVTVLVENTTSGTGGAEFEMKEGGGGDWLVKAIQNNGGFKIRDKFVGQDRLTITNTGNVGIGTLFPTQKLDVVGGNIRSDTGFCIGSNCITSWPSGGGGGLGGGGTLNYLSKWTASGTLGNSQVYDNGSNVGIGTTNPGAKINIVGTDDSSGWVGLKVNNPADTRRVLIGISTTANGVMGGFGVGYDGKEGGVHFNTATGDGHFYSGGNGSLIFTPGWFSGKGPQVVMTSSGNVGIGTMTPFQEGGGGIPQGSLEAKGGIKALGLTFGDWGSYAGSSAYRQWMGRCAAGSSCSQPSIPGDYLHISGWTNPNFGFQKRVLALFDHVFIPAGSLNVGQDLTVKSGQFISGQRSNYLLALQADRNMVLYDSGVAVWASNTSVSDIRLKRDIIPVGPVLGDIEKLNVIRFHYTEPLDDQKQHIGLIAQEVEQSFPEFVYTDPTSGYKLINYDKLSVIALEAIKELQAGTEVMKANQDSLLKNALQLDTDGRLVVKEIEAVHLHAQSVESDSGVTVKDRATGEPVCIFAENGSLKSTLGPCSSISGQ